MQKLEIEVTDDLVRRLEPYQDRVPELLLLGLQQLKISESLMLYERGIVSFARAAELAGVPREDMTRQARAAGIQPKWSAHMADEELV